MDIGVAAMLRTRRVLILELSCDGQLRPSSALKIVDSAYATATHSPVSHCIWLLGERTGSVKSLIDVL